MAKVDELELNQFINDYKPFIIKTLSQVSNKFIDVNNDDALTDGMMAFHEAIMKYDIDKGNFLSFATLVIKRRYLDTLRKESKHLNRTDALDIEDQKVSEASIDKHFKEVSLQAVKDEIDDYNRLLASYGLSFQDLVKHSPKKALLRVLYLDISHFIYVMEMLRDKFLETGRLPIKEVLEAFKVNRKKVERGRVYILSVVVLKNSTLNYLKSYIEKR